MGQVTLKPKQDIELEENMVLSVECPYFELGFGGLEVEDMICVIKTGFRYLSHMPREFYVS